MNGIDRDYSSFAQTGEGQNDDVTAWGEGDGAVEFHGRLVGFRSDPGCAERFGQFTMRLAASRDIDLAVPGLQNCDREVGGGSEAEQANAFAWFDSSNTQAAKTDDAGAEQRSRVQIIEGFREGENEVGASESILAVSASYCVTGEGGGLAEIFETLLTVSAGAVGSTEPGNADPRTERKIRCCSIDDFSHDLVSRDNSQLLLGQLAFDDVKVSPAYAASSYAQQHVSGPYARVGNIDDLQGTLCDGARRGENSGFHKTEGTQFHHARDKMSAHGVHEHGSAFGSECDESESVGG